LKPFTKDERQMKFQAVLLIGFGGPETPADVRPFLDNVLRGRPVPPDRYEEVVQHYLDMGGRSPYNELTQRQAAGLQRILDREGPALPVYLGMRNWHPYLVDTLSQMQTDGVERALGIILAPQQGEASWGRYQGAVTEAQKALEARDGSSGPEIVYSPGWHNHWLFIEAQADKLKCKMTKIPFERRAGARLFFVAHSVPVRLASPYVEQLRESCAAVAEEAGCPSWDLVYQSRSGSPRDPWLEPDICEALGRLADEGIQDVVVVPISFVCDHVEVLFDLDLQAAEVAKERGLGYYRVCTVHDHPSFIRMMADLVRRAQQENETA
jgi:protoporphyrin/coproporphyrin ferrochelatase